MTHTHRKRQRNEEDNNSYSAVEPGVQITCDICTRDLTHSVRIKCVDPACDTEEGIDICPLCFCGGKEIRNHKRNHAYRVMEPHNYPIFSEEWSADEENMLLEGILFFGLGNWQAIAAHIGGKRTKEEVEKHYSEVYIDSPNWPLPVMDRQFSISDEEFRERKKARMTKPQVTSSQPKPVTSAPGVHEVATFLPGRLEFEHELDNDAEDLVKDLEFGMVMEYGGDKIIEDKYDPDVRARAKMEEERRANVVSYHGGKGMPNGLSNGLPNGHLSRAMNADVSRRGSQPPKQEDGNTEADDEDTVEELTQPPPFETKDSIAFKLTLLEMYSQRVQKRHEAKALMFDRGLLDYKKMQASDKKRPREEKEIVTRLRPFAKLQTGEDFEEFITDILYEHALRKRIQDLQFYRKQGLRTAADIEQYEADLVKRAKAKEDYSKGYYPSERVQQLRAQSARGSSAPDGRQGSILSIGDRRSRSREPTPSQAGAPGAAGSSTGPAVRKPPAPLNLANSPSLHLLTPAEQTLCSQLRILPKPYLVIKETLVREYARRGGKLRRREARDLVKIDVNKTSRVWDFLVQSGYLSIGQDTSTSQDNSGSAATASQSVPPASSSAAQPNGAAQTATPAPSQSLLPQSSWPS
ncbi:SWIRM-domain-containing protein [Heliocybe sulcata]|uniref:Transcriptional adapter 2 n=1 Tax=Heliocybe sulcata TaxID=5364 RepID=A0A5C3NLP9_9AGAM|nr:SWIRM-domain-containing protein [Heliocybe sulcata]